MASEFEDIAAKYGEKPQPSDFAHIADKYGEGPSYGQMALDVAKQIPSGLVAGTEAIATFPAQAVGFLGGLAEKYIPGLAPDPEAATNRQKLLDLLKEQRKGIAEYLPKPETRAGQFARTAAEFVPSAIGGARATQFSVPRAAGVGATAGVTSEALGQATEGTPVEPYARAAGAIVAGTAAARMAEGAAAKSAVKEVAKATEQAGDKGFNQFRASGFSLDPAAAPTYSQVLKTELQGRGLTPRTAEKTWAALDDIEKTPFTSPTQFQDRYKELGSIARKATDSEERLAANIAQERLLGFLENPPPWVVQGGDPVAGAAMLREANANWAAAQRAKNLDQRIAAGELRAGANYSGLNLENELRRRVGVLADPKVARQGFTPAEQAAFQKFSEGTFRSNAPRYIKNILGGGGGLGALAAGGAGAGAGAYFGLDPLTYAGATTLAGLGLAKYGNMNALRRARELELMLLERSPYATSAGVPSIRSGAPVSLAPATLNTIGENYDQPLRLTVRPSDR